MVNWVQIFQGRIIRKSGSTEMDSACSKDEGGKKCTWKFDKGTPVENIHLESEADVSKAALLHIIRTEVLRIGSEWKQLTIMPNSGF